MATEMTRTRLLSLAQIFLVVSLCFSMSPATPRSGGEQHLLYVASPGIRNYTEYGGVGILVFDIDHGYKFLRRVPTWDVPAGQKAENVKGIAASAATGRVYVTTLVRMIAIDAVTGKTIWDKPYEGGCDRLAISPDGKDAVRPRIRRTGVARRGRHDRRRDCHNRDQVRLAQYDLLSRWRARLHGRPEISRAFGGRRKFEKN
jgi:hypothetical protein